MSKSNITSAKRLKKTSLCQHVALTHTVEPVLTCTQIATRLGRSVKTVRHWLQQAKDAPKAFKDQNRWMVRISDYQRWERKS